MLLIVRGGAARFLLLEVVQCFRNTTSILLLQVVGCLY